MKKSRVNALGVIAFMVLMFSLLAFEIIAQQEPVSPEKTPVVERVRQRPMMPIIAALDKNGDRIIDAEELKNAPAALKTLDKNSDGKLTEDEYRTQRPERAGGQQKPAEPSKEVEKSSEKAVEQPKVEKAPGQVESPAPAQGVQRERRSFVLPIVSALDKNQDQVIDSDEIEKASDSLKTLDKNSDGQLAMDELFPQRSRDRESAPESKPKSEK
jgi:Ca2+-binding EF-hand superfamily protein